MTTGSMTGPRRIRPTGATRGRNAGCEQTTPISGTPGPAEAQSRRRGGVGQPGRHAPRALNLLFLLVFLVPRPGGAEPPATLRVGTSGDYAPFSSLDADGERSGFDVALARAYARDRKLEIEWVPFRWPALAEDFASGRFDVVMGGITVRPERSAAGRFSLPVARSGAVVLVPESSGLDLAALDAPAIRLAVNAGGHLERAARARFPRARILAVPDNARVLDALRTGRCDGVVTDDREAPKWRAAWEEAGAPILRVLGPFTRDRKAYWWPPDPDSAARARDLDRWLLQQEAGGALAELRAAHLGGPEEPPTAHPWPALLAALDERLALMPAVAAVKRRDGRPIEAREVESRVIAAGRRAVRREAEAANRPPPPDARTEAVYRAFIEAAKAVQRATPEDAPVTLELDAIRPALLRIGDKLAFLLVRLPGPTTPDGVDAMTRALRADTALADIDAAYARAIARALESLAAGRQASLHAGAPAQGQPERDRHGETHGIADAREWEAEDRDLPGDEAVDRQERPAHHEGHDGRVGGAGAEHHRGERHRDEGARRRHRSREARDHDAAHARLFAQPAADALGRHQLLGEPRRQERDGDDQPVADEHAQTARQALGDQLAPAALPGHCHEDG